MGAYEESVSWTRAYLQWQDGDAADAGPGNPDPDLRKVDVFSETMLLMSSRTRSDFRQIAEALRQAERLVQDDRGAWQALGTLRVCDRRRASRAAAEPSWEEKLDAVAADIQALERKLLALQSGARDVS